MTKNKINNTLDDTEKIKLVIAFAAFVIGVILLIFTLVLTVIAPIALPVTIVSGIIGLVSTLGGGLLGGVALKQLLTGRESRHK